jgi:hypothetical protein
MVLSHNIYTKRTLKTAIFSLNFTKKEVKITNIYVNLMEKHNDFCLPPFQFSITAEEFSETP